MTSPIGQTTKRKLSRPTQGERERLNKMRRRSASLGVKLGKLIAGLPDNDLRRFTRLLKRKA
jgi:hypothetical protein